MKPANGNDCTFSAFSGQLASSCWIPFELKYLCLCRAWVQDSWDYFASLAMSPLAKETGQTLVPGFVLSDDPEFVQVNSTAGF